MDLQEVKSFLKVDFDDDDSYILLLIDAAKEYIIDSVGKYDASKARMRVYLLNIVSTLYEKRSLTVELANQKDEKVQYALMSIARQLRLDEV